MNRDIPQAVFDSKEARRVQSSGHREACAELDRQPRHALDTGNPNHPMYNNQLFGYDERELLAKQYR